MNKLAFIKKTTNFAVMNIQKLVLYTLFCLLALSACKFQRIRKGDAKEKYDAAIRYYEKRDYYRAGLLLEEVLPLIRGTKEYEIASFYYAYCHFHQRQYTLGADYFRRFYENFRGSKFAEEARYMQVKSLYKDSAPYYLDQANTIEAINTTQSYLNAYTNSNYMEECNKILQELRGKLEKKAYENARLYYKIGYFHAAIVAFNNFRREFPDSQSAEEALYLSVESQFKYAKQSIEKKQPERYRELVKIAEDFMERYPESKNKKSVKSYLDRGNYLLANPHKLTASR
jgi:outer membrane protein assembly factor BamD